MAIPVLVLATFVVVIIALIFCIITTPKIPIPFTRHTMTFSYIYPPLIGVIFLVITVQIGPWEAIKAGIVGDDKLKPYAILLLIVSMSMICTALDFTGALSFFAFHLVSKFVTTRLRLLTLLFILSSLFGVFSSSHSVVMTTAPLILYITQFAKISAVPYLFAGFYAANLSSLFLLIGNPTNIIVGSAFNVAFADFSKFMFLPAVAALGSGYVMLLFKFHEDMGLTKSELFLCRQPALRYVTPTSPLPTAPSNLTTALNSQPSSINGIVEMEDGDSGPATEDPSKIYLPALDPSSELKDRFGAVFHTIILLAALIIMGLSSFISEKLELWHIALPASVVSILYCVIAYPFLPSQMTAKRQRKKHTKGSAKSASGQAIVSENGDDEYEDGPQPPKPATKQVLAPNGMIITVPLTEAEMRSPIDDGDQDEGNLNDQNKAGAEGVVPTSHFVEDIANDDEETLGDVAHRELCSWNILLQTPVDICIFLICMFVLVQTLVETGWVEEMAFFVLTLIGGRNSLAGVEATDPLASRRAVIVFILSLLTLALSNLLSAQPATIFLTRLLLVTNDIVQKYQADARLPELGMNKDYTSSMVYTVIAGSNYAGILTLIGSISGIIFAKIVNAKVVRQEEEYKRKLDSLLVEQSRVDPRYYLKLQQERVVPGSNGVAAGAWNYTGPRRLADIFSDNYEDEADIHQKRRLFHLTAAQQLSPELRSQLPIYFDDMITYTRFSAKGLFVLPGIVIATGLAVFVASFYAPGIEK